MSKHPRVDSSIHDAYEILGGFLDTKLFLTAEHAEERVPEGFHFRPEDERLRGTHWAYDLGVSELTRELSEALEAPGVLARFTRAGMIRPQGRRVLVLSKLSLLRDCAGD